MYCDCGYAADTEAATVRFISKGRQESRKSPRPVSTIEDVAVLHVHEGAHARRWHLSMGMAVRWCALYPALTSSTRSKVSMSLATITL